jgi:hypothetical protein
MASIRRIPAATAPSEIILKCQISAVVFYMDSPIILLSPNSIIRTESPFSPNKAIAPFSMLLELEYYGVQ